MLVLSRKCGERIVMGDNVELIVVAIRENRVQLGVNAPKSVAVHRDELHRHSIPEERFVESKRTAQGLRE